MVFYLFLMPRAWRLFKSSSLFFPLSRSIPLLETKAASKPLLFLFLFGTLRSLAAIQEKPFFPFSFSPL